jgi:hypothetical protein
MNESRRIRRTGEIIKITGIKGKKAIVKTRVNGVWRYRGEFTLEVIRRVTDLVPEGTPGTR